MLNSTLKCIGLLDNVFDNAQRMVINFRQNRRRAVPFPSPWLCLIVGIPTDPTSTSVPLPLPSEPSAVGLVVVVVGQRGEPKPPGGDSWWRLYKPTVGGDHVEGDQQQQQHHQPHAGQVGGDLMAKRKWASDVPWLPLWQCAFVECGDFWEAAFIMSFEAGHWTTNVFFTLLS